MRVGVAGRVLLAGQDIGWAGLLSRGNEVFVAREKTNQIGGIFYRGGCCLSWGWDGMGCVGFISGERKHGTIACCWCRSTCFYVCRCSVVCRGVWPCATMCSWWCLPPLLPCAGSPRPEPESGIYGMVIRYGLIVRNELFLPCRERFGCSALLDHLCVYFLVECNRNVTTTAVS